MKGAVWIFLFIVFSQFVMAYTIDGNSVYIDDSRAQIEITPHTRTGSGWVEVELESKQYDGNITMAFGVNTEFMKPTIIERYNPHNEIISHSYTCEGTFQYTTNPNYFYCYENETIVKEGSFDTGDLQSGTAYWDETVLKYWSPVPRDVQQIDFDFDGKNKWYLIENIPVSQGVAHRARIYVEIPDVRIGENQNAYNSKYDFAFYPSSYGLNVYSANQNGQLYFIDPWTQGDEGLTAYYDFDNNFDDHVGTNDGTDLNTGGIDTGTKKVGAGSLDCDGNGHVAFDSYWNLNQSFSVAFWANYDSGGSHGGVSNGWQSNEEYWYAYMNAASPTFNTQIRDDGNDANVNLAPTFPCAEGAWCHFVSTWNESSSTLTMYINGSMLINDTDTNVKMTSTATWGAGAVACAYRTSGGIWEQFDGQIDELAVWNRMLSSSEVDALWNSGAGINYSDIVEGTGVVAPAVDVLSIKPLNSTSEALDNFSTEFLEEIEYSEIVFNFTLRNPFDTILLNYTADGTNGCATGNLQSICLNNDSGSYVTFQNGSVTATYDGTTGNAGDSITMTRQGNSTDFNLTYKIDEHYNPNIKKWYQAAYTWSDVLWTSGSQEIRGSQMLRIEVPDGTPLDADQYKLDFRVNASQSGMSGDLEAYLCNSTYTTGAPHLNANCQLVASKDDSQLQDDGTKFRGVFSKGFIDSLGDIKYVILRAAIPASQHYSLKTYAFTNATHSEKISYSINSGSTWTAMTNDYESELNINYFYNTNQTQTIYTVWVNNTNGDSVTATAIQNWTIDANQNYAPIVQINAPSPDEVISSAPYTFNFTIADSNDDNLTGNITIFNNSVVYLVVANLTKGNTTASLVTNITNGDYNLTLTMCENETSDLFCDSDTHTFSMSVATATSANLSCQYNSEPYYFVDGFDVFCRTQTVSNFSCVGMLSFNEEIIQVAPEPTTLRDADRLTRFYDSDGNVVISFTREGLRHGEELNMSIFCATSAQSMFYNATLTPTFKEPYMVEDYTLWFINPTNTRGMILLLFSVFIIMTIVWWIWRMRR